MPTINEMIDFCEDMASYDCFSNEQFARREMFYAISDELKKALREQKRPHGEMSDKYGYIGIETLLNFCSNQKDHCITPNDFMRMNRIKIDERPHGEWIEDSYAGIHCSECDYFPLKDVVITIYADGARVKRGNYNLTPYCPNCGADMRKKEGEENV